ncbi:MAG: hypothetical protein QXL59_01930 [Candidatus Jordarchaeales archaeon]
MERWRCELAHKNEVSLLRSEEEEIDWKAVGFKAGLEIHQELLTTRKLFCRCPPNLRNDPPHFTVKRFFRPVLGEMGEFDPAMLAEYEKGKTVIYEGYYDTTCTYEVDETYM